MPRVIHDPKANFVNLDHDQMLVLSDRRGSRVEVLFGGVWLTEERDPDDRFVEAGQSLRIKQRGRVIAEAIGRTGLHIIDPDGSLMARWRRLVERIGSRRAALAQHTVATVLAVMIGVGLAEMTASGMQGHGSSMHAVIASTAVWQPV